VDIHEYPVISGNSVLLVMIIHAMNNTANELFSPMFTGIYSTELAWMKALVWGLVALIVLVVDRRWWTQTSGEEPEPVLKTA
jgi:hypothetical protein